MSVILVIIVVVLTIYLLIVAAVNPVGSRLSKFELKRRQDKGDKEAEAVLGREGMLSEIISLRQTILSVLIVIISQLSVVTFGWFVGLIVSVLIAIEYPVVSNLRLFRSLSEKLYDRQEKHVMKIIKKYRSILKFVGGNALPGSVKDREISSRQELQHLVDESVGVLTSDEKKLIVNGLSFTEKKVKEIMTPKSMIDSIKSSEFLGPLVLNDLHATGHTRLPVIKNDIDHVVGILNLKELLSLDIKRSTTAEKAMETKVYYIHEDQNLQHALAAFLKTHQQLFIVVNEYRETVGLISIEDVIEALLGREIIDEFDNHDNLRQVALRNPRSNNQPRLREDV